MRLLESTTLALATMLIAGPLAAQQTTPRAPSPTPSTKTPAPPTPATGARPRPPAGGLIPFAPVTTGYLQGVAVDSVNGGPLVAAMVQVENTDRIAISDSLGRFLIDSIKPGSYRVLLDHPVLDTLGISMATQPMEFVANEVTRAIIAVPTGEFLASRFCTAARRTLGPGVLVGRVREPDSEVPAIGARVSFVWYDPEPVGLPQGVTVKMTRVPRVREATVGQDGTYRLCGLPLKYEGKLQAQRKDGGATAEVPLSQDESVLTLRSMSVAKRVVAATPGATGTEVVQKGSARVLGRVTNAAGAPVPNARVGLMGTSAATLTRADGSFSLDSLPAGTQALIVRQLGYAPTEVPVELTSRAPVRVAVKMGAYVPELSAVEVVSRRDQGLDRVGFMGRKRGAAGGHYLTPEQIEARRAIRFTDLLTTIPGIRVQGSMGRMQIVPTRGTGGGCVTVYVDGSRWQQLEAGDLDSFVQPHDVAAIEVHQGTSAPVEFQTPGSDCSAVVVWTKTHVDRRRK